MASRLFGRVRERLANSDPPLAPDQQAALQRWQARSNVAILLAAIVPLFVISPKSRVTELVVGIGSWLVFAYDLRVRRRIMPDYLHRRNGRIDLAIVVLTFPFYLIPGAGNYTAVLLFARLARVARVLLTTRGLRRLAARLGTVAWVTALVLTVCSLAAYEAEHPTNPGFATVGDAFWWGIVTITTVGYGDIVPKTFAGRAAGVALMVTGVAVLGVLAGSLAAFFHLDAPGEPDESPAAPEIAGAPPPIHAELASLQAELKTIDRRLGELASRARADRGGAGTTPAP
jgi:voltage-gated potassium channel